MCCPAPYCRDPVHGQIQGMADHLAAELSAARPRITKSGWATPGPRRASGAMMSSRSTATPICRGIQGRHRSAGRQLRRSVRPGRGPDGALRGFQVVGYNVLVGGGIGITPPRKTPFPPWPNTWPLIRPEQAVDVVRAISGLPRLRQPRGPPVPREYLVADWGLEKFKARVEARLGYALAAPQAEDIWDVDDHVGWHEQGDGRWFYGLHVATGGSPTRASATEVGLREICRKPSRHRPDARPRHPLLRRAAGEPDRHRRPARRHGVKLDDEISNVRRWSTACGPCPPAPGRHRERAGPFRG